MPKVNCQICSSLTNICANKFFDDRYGYPGQFSLASCPKCGHKSLYGDFTAEMLTRLYTDFYPRSSLNINTSRPYKEVHGLSAWLNGEKCSAFRWVPRNVRILDIGCGFGETLGYHAARGCNVYGVEADENIRRVADKFGYKVHVGLFDPSIYEPDFFDYVTLDQVIEHMTDPLETLRGVARVLKPGGVAILSTPNAYGWGARLFGQRWINWHAPYHIQFFSRRSMAIAATEAGLDVEAAKTITSSEWLLYQWIHLFTRPQQGEPSPFWSPSGKRALGIRILQWLFVQLHRTKINHVITRLFDEFGYGDNMLYFLRKR